MPCDFTLSPEQTAAERRREVDRALVELERSINRGAVQVKIGPDGAVCFSGWGEERRRVTDPCAYRTLVSRGSWDLRQAVVRAEALSGNRVNEARVAAGVHSHNGGGSWSTD
jgi:hypothetical protein